MQDSFPLVEGITHRFIKANSMNLHLAEAGRGGPLLMLPAPGNDRRSATIY